MKIFAYLFRINDLGYNNRVVRRDVVDRSTTRHRKSSLSRNYPSFRPWWRATVIEYVYREVHWPWSAANRLIATEWCSRFRRYISHYGKWRDETRRMTSRTVERIRREPAEKSRRCEKRGKREERRGLREEFERYRIITLAFFLFHRSSSPSFHAIQLSIFLRTSRVSLFNDCGTTIDITCREWTSNEPVTPSVCVDDGRSLIFKDIAGTLPLTQSSLNVRLNVTWIVRTLLASSITLFSTTKFFVLISLIIN